jgi:uncharacterized protein (TIGR00369 family)
VTTETRIRENFSRQAVMGLLGVSIERVAPGEVDLSLPYRADLCQQNGFLHAGVVTAVVDSACGYAALSLMPEGADVLSVEFKVNLLSPARGQRFVAQGRILKAGRTITVCTGELWAHDGGKQTRVCVMQATMMTMLKRA